MIERLLAAGSAKVTLGLAIAVLVLVLLLGLSIWGNVHQFNAHATTKADLGAKLAAAVAHGKSEVQACEATNDRNVGTVQALGVELHACRGENQRVDEALALAIRQRDRAKTDANGQRAMREEVIKRIYETNTECREWAASPVCRARSEQLLGKPAASPTG